MEVIGYIIVGIAALISFAAACQMDGSMGFVSLFLILPMAAISIAYIRFVYYIFNVLISISLTLKLIQAKQENEAEEKAKAVHGEQ